MRRLEMATRVKRMVIAADIHAGHRTGLTHPNYQPTCSADAPRALRKMADMRSSLWDWFAEEVKKIKPIDLLVFNGDAIEGKGLRSGGTELITADREEQADMAAAVINYFGARRVSATYGTPYHTGADEDWENIVFHRVENFGKIEAEGHYDCNGLQVAAKHFIGNTSSAASRGTSLSNAQIKQLLWAARGQQPQANMIFRSHIHRCWGAIDAGGGCEMWTTPGLQGLGSKFGARQCDGLPIDFGFIVLDVRSKNEYSLSRVICPMSLEAASVVRV